MYSGLHVQYPLSCPIFTKLEFTRQIFENSSNIKFHKNTSSGGRVVPCGRTDRRTDTTKLLVVFRNFANASKQCVIFRITCVATDIQIYLLRNTSQESCHYLNMHGLPEQSCLLAGIVHKRMTDAEAKQWSIGRGITAENYIADSSSRARVEDSTTS